MEPYWIHNHGGAPIDNGIRSVDIVRYPIGPLCQVFVVEGRRNRDLDGEDAVNMSMCTFDGVCANVGLSWSINGALDDIIRAFGTNGSIRLGRREFGCRQASSPDTIVFGSGHDKLAAFRRRLGDFCSRMPGIEPRPVGSGDAVASADVITFACDSLAGGQWVTIDSSSGRPGALREVATRPAG